MARKKLHGFSSPLRYPGGKGALSQYVKLVISQNGLLDGHYAEIYAGGAGIAWPLLFEEFVHMVHINDVDPVVAGFWRIVLTDAERLCRMIEETEVTMDEWHRQRAIHLAHDQHSPLEVAFSTFFLNRTNRSGILSAGVIGGQQQAGVWRLDARYNKSDLVDRIRRIASYRGRIQLYEQDAAQFITTVLPDLPADTLPYLDPPYFHKGRDLYRNFYAPADHAHIAELVTNQIEQPWIVSYDAVPEIINLYDGLPNVRYSISYSAADRYAGSEVIFHSPRLTMPNVDSPVSARLMA